MTDMIITFFILILTLSYAMTLNLFQTITIIPILITLSLVAFMYIIKDKKFQYGVFLIYLFLSIFYADFLLLMPVIIYTLSSGKPTDISIVGLILIALQCTSQYAFIHILVIGIIALCFKHYQMSYQEIFEKSHLQRDTMAQNALLLAEKNAILKSNQDAEVHVATLKERNRISRDLHDTVGHMLASALLQLGAIQTINKQENLNVPLNTLKETLKKGMESTRESVHQLYDTSLDLNLELSKLFEELRQKVDYHYQLQYPLTNASKRQILAIFKEAVHNIQKHSNASTVQILIHEQPAFLQFSIADNGTNISISKGGMGLENIAARVNTLNGHLTISHQDGFKIFFTIPKEDSL